MSTVINPTGNSIRNDAAGGGDYGAPRGSCTHNGTDFLCTPGQKIKSPITGRISRISRPYSNDTHFSGVYIIGKHVSIKLWYFQPYADLIGERVPQGQVIGVAQDVSAKYPGQNMSPHVHLKIERCDPLLLMD